jgi:hypothetical protein
MRTTKKTHNKITGANFGGQLMRLLALSLISALVGCSAAHHSVKIRQTKPSAVYVYWGSNDSGSANRFLSAPLHFDEEILIGGDDFLQLRGHIQRCGTNLVADLMGSTGQQSQWYRGHMALEKPFFTQGAAASGGAGPFFWFMISTNLDCRPVLEHVNMVRGFTNAPFSHTPATQPEPISNVPTNIDPSTGLPWGDKDAAVDPITGLPVRSASAIFTQQMFSILKACETIKPGMARADLSMIFTAEGGLSTPKRRTFVHDLCTYIKIDVEFAPTESGKEQPTDIITRVSKPYLAWSVQD